MPRFDSRAISSATRPFRSRGWVAVFVALAASACFHGRDAEGLRCESDEQCGNGQSCDEGYCGGPPAGVDLCGNGYVDAGEECDEGEANDDSGSCTTNCTAANCGDELVQSGEACDDGPEGSEMCDADCSPAECGDATVNAAAGEECEPAVVGQSSATCMSNCLMPLLWEDAEAESDWTDEVVDPPLTSEWFRSDAYQSGGALSWHSGAPGAQAGSTRLVSPPFGLDGSESAVTLRMQHRYTFDAVGLCDSEDNQSDGAIVEYSVDGGAFTRLDPDQGYPGVLADDGDCGGLGQDQNPLLGTPAYTRKIQGFESAQFDLTGITGQVRIGLRVALDCAECPEEPDPAAGWYVDDVVVYRGALD